MSSSANNSDFYAPDTKEMELGICYVLEEAGGHLSQERVAEVLADCFQIPDQVRNIPRWNAPSPETVWSYRIAWAMTRLRNEGFAARNSSETRDMCMLTDHGQDLGRWAVRIYEGENRHLPDWVAAFLQPIRRRIKNLLDGGKRRKPPDYELCRWVRYCYLLNWPEQGVAIFNRILADHVEPVLYRQAERQSRILRVRLQEQTQDRSAELPPLRRVEPRPGAMTDLKEWLMTRFPPGSRIPTLVRAGHNEIEEFDDAGMVIVPSGTNQSYLVSWGLLEAAYSKLQESHYVSQHTLGFRGNFLCSLLALFRGAERVPGECAVRLVGNLPIDADATNLDHEQVSQDDTSGRESSDSFRGYAGQDSQSTQSRTCPRCGRPLRRVHGPVRPFVGCSGYPDCTYTEDLPTAKRESGNALSASVRID